MKPYLFYRSTILFVALLVCSQAHAQSLFGKKWMLTEVNGAAVSSAKAYIEFDNSTKRFSGDGGCNRFSGRFEMNGANIRFSQTISTKRACLDNQIQQIENDFLSALERVTNFQIQGNYLRLNNAGRSLLAFRSESGEPGGDPQEARVTGTVTYRQRIALPARAVLKVRLVDVSRAGGRSTTIAEQIIPTSGRQVPFAFELPYPPDRIRQNRRYVIQARIENRGRLLFINTRAYPVITNGNPDTANVIVQPVGR